MARTCPTNREIENDFERILAKYPGYDGLEVCRIRNGQRHYVVETRRVSGEADKYFRYNRLARGAFQVSEISASQFENLKNFRDSD
jgi:hypothetical protein